MVENVEQWVNRFRGITPERVKRSLKARTMRAIGRMGPVRSIVSLGYQGRGDVHSALFPRVDPGAVAETVRRDGVCLGLKLPDDIVKEFVSFAHSTPAYGNRSPSWGFHVDERKRAEEKAGVKFTLGSYFNTYDSCPAVRQLANDPVLTEIALRYVGPRAQHLGTNMWWSYAKDSTHADRHEFAQLFHFDLDDYKFIKFFFYLTDVDEGSGPHVYVRGTHKQKLLKHMYPMRRLEDAEVEAAYGRERVMVLQGKAGEGFAEDTFGLHKGAAPTTRDRLILQFEFAISQGYTDDRCDPALLKML